MQQRTNIVPRCGDCLPLTLIAFFIGRPPDVQTLENESGEDFQSRIVSLIERCLGAPHGLFRNYLTRGLGPSNMISLNVVDTKALQHIERLLASTSAIVRSPNTLPIPLVFDVRDQPGHA